MKHVLRACVALVVSLLAAWSVRAEAFEPPPAKAASNPLTEKPNDADRKVLKQMQETIVSFTLNEQPAMEALEILSTLGSVNIVPDRKKFKDPAATVTLKVTNVPVDKALKLMTEEMGLTYIIRDGVVFVTDEEGVKKAAEAAARTGLVEEPTDADRKVLKALLETNLSFTFNEQPVMEALDFFSTLGNVNIVTDRKKFPDPNKAATLKLSNVSLGTAIKLLTEQLGLVHVIRDGVVFISDEAGVKKAAAVDARTGLAEKATAAERKVLKALQEPVVSFTFNEQPVREALDFLATLGNINIVADRKKFREPAPSVTIKLTNVSLETALKLLLEQIGLTYVIRDRVVFITDEEGVKKAAAADARTGLAEKPTDAERKVLKRLQETMVSFTFNEQPVKEALEFLSTLGSVNIVADERVFRKRGHEVTVRHYDPLMEIFMKIPADVIGEPEIVVTLKVNNVTLETAIKLLVEQMGLTYVIRDGAVFISDEKGIVEGPVTVIVGEEGVGIVKTLAEKKVSFTFNDQAIGGAVGFLGTLSGANILADPRAKAGGKPAPEAKVTLRLIGVSAWEAVRYLAATAGLHVIVSEGAVLLTDLRELTPAAGAAVPAELAKTFDETPVSFEFTKMKLGDAMEFLRKAAPVRFGRVIIGENERERPVTLRVRMMSLRNALNWTARFGETSWAVRDNLIVITDEKAEK